MSDRANCSRREALAAGGALISTALLGCTKNQPGPIGKRSGFVPLDGIGVYYELHGPPIDGHSAPLVLMHGGAVTIEADFSPELIARFARKRPVIAIEQQGHGHTADRPERPFAMEQMVADTAGVLSHLKVGKADLLGHSLGGMIATGVAIRRPDLVRTVTTLGSPYRLDGFRPDLERLQRDPSYTPPPDLAKLLPTEADFARWRASFQRVAPDPKAYDRILGRLNVMLTTWQGWSDEQMRSIRAPMLVAVGDNDFVQVSHAAQMARLVPNGRLAVLPGTTHFGIVKRDAWLEPMMASLTDSSL